MSRRDAPLAVAEILAPPPRRERNWSARARGTGMDALRYTQFVTIMKRALPAAAFLVITTVVAFFFLQRQPERFAMTFERIGRIENDLAMVKPRLSGADDKGNPFVVTADKAVQDNKDPHRARLYKVDADLSVDKTSWINATAARGLIDMDKHMMWLDGGIAAFSDSGYELHTQRASVDLKAGLMTGPVEVTGHGPAGTLRADRFTVDRRSNQIMLMGNVHMTMYAKAS